jgi:decaprenyl-phosphate phosphoribosyltransferase
MYNKNSLLISSIQLTRPYQWAKNILLFAPLFFTFELSTEKLFTVLLGFVVFNLAASTIYITNDYNDIKEDQAHPIKKDRPLASGAVSKKNAVLLASFLFTIALLLALNLPIKFSCIVFSYIILNILYTFKLKHIAILDITIIAIGFVLRIFAGAALINNTPSMWIILVTFLLALFLALAKRRDDCLLMLTGKKTRTNIDGYNLEMVNASMTLMAGVTIISYIMYSVSPEVTLRLGTQNLYLTSIFVIVGILRYMQLTFVEENSGNPTKIALTDKFLRYVILSWILSFIVIIKFGN